ncbi:MAG: cellulose biosynthesis protein BcsS [Alphaproteobacteria bacterium]|nr:cellulose biosynthesis protein BcsS [Alphaproteobacteria bacterium]
MARMSGGCGRSAAAAKLGRWCALGLCFAAISSFEALAGETWVSAGAGGSADTLYSYGGVTIAPAGTLAEEGWRARGWAKALRINDGVESVSSASMATEITEIHGVGAEAEVGWQFVGPEWRFAVYGGGAWRNEADRGDRLGVTLAAEGSYELNPRWRAIADVKYTVGFDELWAQLRPEFKFDDGLYVGLLSSASKGRGFSILRGGASVGGFSYAVPWMGDVYVSVEAGMEYNMTTKITGPFGALHVGFAY